MDAPGEPDPPAGAERPSGEIRKAADSAFSAAEEAWRAGRFAEAVSHYAKALDAVPSFVEARIGHARALELTDDVDAALRSLDEALTASPDQTEFLVVRGALRGRLRQYRDAEQDLRRVLRLHPAHAPALHELGLVLLHRGRADDAAELLQRALALQSERPGLHLALGDALNRAGQYEAAAEALARATDLAPDDRRAWHIYGRVLDQLHRPEDAAAAYRRSQGYDA